MNELALPLCGVSQADTLRAQNITLKIKVTEQEKELAQVKHALNLALTKAGSWGGMRQRVTISKSLAEQPPQLWERHLSLVLDKASFSDAQVLSALEKQVMSKTRELLNSTEEIAKLRSEIVNLRNQNDTLLQEGSTNLKPAGAAGHFMNQIQFLHDEVERLEGELAKTRQEAAEELRSAHLMHAEAIRQKEEERQKAVSERNIFKTQLAPLQRRVGKLQDGEDLFSRCRQLETQLAAALAEKNEATVEKYDLLTRLRKLEAQFKDKKNAVSVAEKMVQEETAAADEQVRTLRSALEALDHDRTQLKNELYVLKQQAARPLYSSEVQCESVVFNQTAIQTDDTVPETTTATCQVDTIIHYADVGSESLQTVVFNLEKKCRDVDEARAELEELSKTHQETLRYLEHVKGRLAEEMARRKEVEVDAEKLSLQVRGFQQQASQQTALLREKEQQIIAAERKVEEATKSMYRLEEQQRAWEEEWTNNARDMQHLVADQNVVHSEMEHLTNENDSLRDNVEKLLLREQQCNHALRAKDMELGELMTVYQNATHEMEQHMAARRTLERECDNLRAIVATKEEQIMNLMQQVSDLHSREQQLAIDVQAADFQNSELRRKIFQFESNSAQVQAKLQDHQQALAASRRIEEDMERNVAELGKQVYIKDHQCMLLRTRCDELENDFNSLQISYNAASQRLRELEDSNAQLLVRGLVAQAAPPPPSAEKQLREELGNALHSLKSLQGELEKEKAQKTRLGKQLKEALESNTKLSESHERLEQLVMDQATALSTMSS